MSIKIGADGVLLPHYREDGDLYDQLTRVFYTLEPTYIRSALFVCSVVFNADKRGELDDEHRAEALTNREIRRRIEAETGHRFSLSFVKKGLYAVHRVLKNKPDPNRPAGQPDSDKGMALIDRIRQHGRRVIVLLRGIREAGKAKMPKPGEPIIPLCTPPPEKREDQETTTTGNGSSSSPKEGGGERDGPDPAVVWALYERARNLLTEVTVKRVSHAVETFTADWVRRVLDQVEKRNRIPGNVRKPWGFALGWLKNWAKEGGPPEDPQPAPRTAARETKPLEADLADQARDEHLRAAWDALSESDREAIRAKVKAANPGIRWPNLLEPLYLVELERRL
jgi:hypothetical protein